MSKKRLVASGIDLIIFSLFGNLTGSLIILCVPQYIFKNDTLNTILVFVLMILNFLVFLNKDGIFGYNSIGKKIMKLKIFDDNDEIVTNKKILFLRNFESFKYIISYVPMILTKNQSAGDEKYHTYVDN